MIEEAKFPYCPLGKAFENQTKKIEDRGEKQRKGLKEHGKQLTESIELVKIDFDIDRDSIPFDEQRKIFNELNEERSSEFKNFEKIINPDNLICEYKNGRNESKML